MKTDGIESRFDSHEPPRTDKYDYSYFTPEENPDGELLAKQIQAQSYVNMRIVRPEGLITLANGAQIMAPSASNPSGVPYVPIVGSRAEYALGIEKGTTDLNPMTGRLVAWKKLYAPLDALPAYQFSKDVLWSEGEQYLRSVEADPGCVLVEPEALGKTINAGRAVVKEFIRAEIQRVLGRGEVWFMGLVEATAFESFVHNWGQTAVKQIGPSKQTFHPQMCSGIALVPTVMNIDSFYDNMAYDILTPGNKFAERQLTNFVYMSDGVSDTTLGSELAEFRVWACNLARAMGGTL